VIWKKFIAHGVDKQPYFLKDKIIANAEDDNWFELDYNGKLLDTTCEYKANLFVEDIKCVQNFVHLTHDDRGISQYFLQEYFGDYENLKVSSYNNYTFLLKNIFENHSLILKDESLNLYTKNLVFAKEFFGAKLKILNYQQRETVFKKLTASLQFDIRTIEKDLDVQAVFETMNNRGKPLSTLEKLKNRLIYLTAKLKNEKEDKYKLRKNINRIGRA